MDTLKKAELAVSIHHIARFLKPGIPIYNSEVPDTDGKKNKKKNNTDNCKAFCVWRKRKMYSTSCADIDHDVTTFEVDGMV